MDRMKGMFGFGWGSGSTTECSVMMVAISGVVE